MTAHIATPRPFARVWPHVVLIAALFCISYMTRSVLSPVLVAVEHSLGVGHAQATSLLFAQGVGFALSQCTVGAWCGYIPPRWVATISLTVSGLALMGVYFTQTLWQACGVFLLVGVGTGVYFPSALAVLGSIVCTDDWGRAISVHEMAPNIGFILLPLLAEAVTLLLGWKSLFLVVGGLSVGFAALFALVGQGGWRTTERPSVRGYTSLMRMPGTWVVMLLMAVALCGEFSVFSTLQLFLVDDKGFSPATANFVLSFSRLVTPLGVIAGGWLADTWRTGPVLAGALLLHTVCLLLMAAGDGALLYAACAVQALSIATLFPALFKALALAYPMKQQPLLLSLIMPPAGFMANALMPWFLGICGQYASFGLGLGCLAVASGIGAALVPILSASPPKNSDHKIH